MHSVVAQLHVLVHCWASLADQEGERKTGFMKKRRKVKEKQRE